ncbi:MAG: hypothetical protein ABI275_09425 [Terrimesophilobacter sp.]
MTDSVSISAESASTSLRAISARLWLGAVVALAVAVGWFLLAVTNPTTTYHFDPFLVVIAPVALTRLRHAGSLSWRIVLIGTGIGTGLALATTALLSSVGGLRGPGLVGAVSPVAEALIGILLGVTVEVASTLVRKHRGDRRRL